MKIDFTGVSSNFEPIPAGRYTAVLTGFKINDSKSTAGEKVCVLEYTVSDPEYSGRKAWSQRSLQPQALWMLKKDMIALGADGEELSGPIDLEEELENLKGNDVELVLSIREFEGRTNNQVDSVSAA